MIRLGILFSILGFGSLLLPMWGMQFRLMSLLDGGQPFAGITIGVAGLGLIGAGIFTSVNAPGEPPANPGA